MPDTKLRPTIQTAIKTVLEGVSGAVHVFPDQLGSIRLQGPDQVSDRYVDNDTKLINAWFVGRVATASDTAETSRGNVPIRHGLDRTHQFVIEGFYSYQSEVTEPVFQSLVDDILSAFNEKRSLSGFQASPPQLGRIDFQTFVGHLCHHAIITLAVVEKILGLEPV